MRIRPGTWALMLTFFLGLTSPEAEMIDVRSCVWSLFDGDLDRFFSLGRERLTTIDGDPQADSEMIMVFFRLGLGRGPGRLPLRFIPFFGAR